MIAFIDESKSKNYLLALHLVAPIAQTFMRKAFTKQLLAGQRSIHFRKENNRRRNQLLGIFLNMNVKVVIFKVKGLSDVEARRSLIKEVCNYVDHFGLKHLVFELDQSCFKSDVLALNELRPKVIWDHRERHQEPLLWVADAVAWCVNRGGEWERMVRPMIVETIDC